MKISKIVIVLLFATIAIAGAFSFVLEAPKRQEVSAAVQEEYEWEKINKNTIRLDWLNKTTDLLVPTKYQNGAIAVKINFTIKTISNTTTREVVSTLAVNSDDEIYKNSGSSLFAAYDSMWLSIYASQWLFAIMPTLTYLDLTSVWISFPLYKDAQDVGHNDKVIVPMENLIIKNFEHDIPKNPTDIIGNADLLRFVFDNGTDRQEIYYYIWWRSAFGYWEHGMEEIGGFPGLLTFTDTSGATCQNGKEGLVITQNRESQYANTFNEVTIHTYNSKMTVLSGNAIPAEFTVTFQDVERNTVAVVETVNRFIPIDSIPDAPQVNGRPFLYWINWQGYQIDETITADVVFLPLYGYGSTNSEAEEPSGGLKEKTTNGLTAIERNMLIVMCLLGVVIVLAVVSLVIKGRRK